MIVCLWPWDHLGEPHTVEVPSSTSTAGAFTVAWLTVAVKLRFWSRFTRYETSEGRVGTRWHSAFHFCKIYCNCLVGCWVSLSQRQRLFKPLFWVSFFSPLYLARFASSGAAECWIQPPCQHTWSLQFIPTKSGGLLLSYHLPKLPEFCRVFQEVFLVLHLCLVLSPSGFAPWGWKFNQSRVD